MALRTLLFLLIGLLSISAFGQKESEKLRAKQRDIQKKIRYTKQLIGDTKNKERLTMVELGIINQQIAYRNELMSLYGNQLGSLEKRIKENSELLKSLENDLVELKAKYAKMLYFAYKNRHNTSANVALAWLSGDDFNTSYLRMKYLNQIAEYRKLQADFIRKTQAEIKSKQLEIQHDIEEKNKVIKTKAEERKKFENDKSKQRDLLLSLKEEEGKLKSQLDQQQEKKDRLARAIRKAIEKEIAAQSKKSSEGFGTTPESQLQGKNFASNKGRLPWPVSKGEITGKFGKQPHPVIKGVFTQNNGVDISTANRSTMRAVFAGTVTSVFVIPGAGRAVMVSHGNYRTVYANLAEVYISKGDKISSKQEIGVLLPAEKGNVSQAHFEIWKITGSNMEKQNPVYWLAR